MAVAVCNLVEEGALPVVFGIESGLGSDAKAVPDGIGRECHGRAYDGRVVGDFDRIVPRVFF